MVVFMRRVRFFAPPILNLRRTLATVLFAASLVESNLLVAASPILLTLSAVAVPTARAVLTVTSPTRLIPSSSFSHLLMILLTAGITCSSTLRTPFTIASLASRAISRVFSPT